ncbi:MAG: HEAT repeat domain-containing protein [Parachlamydiaceae bacterium]|nr:HEAT repeat domain-containing protein [Parachlamydiaceae bacterium]
MAAISALGKIGGADPHFAIPLLAEALKDIFPSTREAAINALGEIGDKCLPLILPLLFEALKDESSSVKIKAVTSLKKYNLSLYFKSNQELIRDVYKTENTNSLLISTPLNSLITCFKEDLTNAPIYSSAIALKCIEENLAFFQEDEFICFYEQAKLCKVKMQKTSEFLMQIDNHAHQYPTFILELQQEINIAETNTCLIQ